MQRIILIVLSSVLTACSAEQVYDLSQGVRRNECSKLADSDTRDKCFEAADKDYQHYLNDQQDKHY